MKYKVRWKGYAPDDDTWEPEEHLKDCKEVLLEFRRKMLDNKSKPVKKEIQVCLVSDHSLHFFQPIFPNHGSHSLQSFITTTTTNPLILEALLSLLCCCCFLKYISYRLDSPHLQITCSVTIHSHDGAEGVVFRTSR